MKDLLGPEVKQVLLIIPDPESFPSGGNIYNRRLITSLEQQGMQVIHAETLSMCSRQQLRDSHVMMLDSLFLSTAYQSFWEVYPDKKKSIIFHHLPCLELDKAEQSTCFDTYRTYFDSSDHVLVTSDFSKKWLMDQGIDEGKINSIPPTVSWIKNKDSNPQKAKFTGLIVANLIPRKGILAFLQALGKEIPIDPAFELQIAGSSRLDPTYANTCKSFVKESPTLDGKVVFLGEIKPEDMPSLYQQADVLISASTMETFGMALQEAKYMGLPILALGSKTAGGNIHTFIHEENGDHLYANMNRLVKTFCNLVAAYNSSQSST